MYMKFEQLIIQVRKAEKKSLYTHQDDSIIVKHNDNNNCFIFVVENILVPTVQSNKFKTKVF